MTAKSSTLKRIRKNAKKILIAKQLLCSFIIYKFENNLKKRQGRYANKNKTSK